MPSSVRSAMVGALICVLWLAPALAQQPEIFTADQLSALLAERSGISITPPDRGYSWSDSCLVGDEDAGSITVEGTKVIYYFLHWGPVEAEPLTQDYVRERIPGIWPGEGLEVMSVEPATVAGHPAYYAEVKPRREFYRAFFLVWNCPESGRQFIADMNFNVRYHTPRADLDTEVEVTRHTVVCHPGAVTTDVPGCEARFASDRFGIAFDHPLNWYVFENPYGVPHPAYEGVRSRDIGSVLAWLQDRTVRLKFAWETLAEAEEGRPSMSSGQGLYTAAKAAIAGLDGVKRVSPDAYEMVRGGGHKIFKLLGTVEMTVPDEAGPEFVPRASVCAVVVDDPDTGRRLVVTALIDFYEVAGVPTAPARDIFDRLAADLADGLEF